MVDVPCLEDMLGDKLTAFAPNTTGIPYLDEGIGIPRDEQASVFDRFFRVDSGLRRSTQGAGLGLFLVKAIVEAHNGAVWLTSEPGQGATFFFSLPISRKIDGGETTTRRDAAFA